MSVTVSPVPPSPNSLSAFFSLTKDESKRPKYKELLVSAKCGCPRQLLGPTSEAAPCFLRPSRQGVHLHGPRMAPAPLHCL